MSIEQKNESHFYQVKFRPDKHVPFAIVRKTRINHPFFSFWVKCFEIR